MWPAQTYVSMALDHVYLCAPGFLPEECCSEIKLTRAVSLRTFPQKKYLRRRMLCSTFVVSVHFIIEAIDKWKLEKRTWNHFVTEATICWANHGAGFLLSHWGKTGVMCAADLVVTFLSLFWMQHRVHNQKAKYITNKGCFLLAAMPILYNIFHSVNQI